MNLCSHNECRLPERHKGRHNRLPTAAWSFLKEVDQNKINKAGYATPRGGKKGAYQNHVYRNNRVIVPFERLDNLDLRQFSDGYIVRLFPHQAFSRKGQVDSTLARRDPPLVIGENAFVLYRTHQSLTEFPPLSSWGVRGLEKNGEARTRRGRDVIDTGHYVLRIPRIGTQEQKEDGPPQGIFAPEYATAETNYLCQCVLAWLIVSCSDSPYTTVHAKHLRAILEKDALMDSDAWESRGLLRQGITACPLCSRHLAYKSLHEMLSLEDEDSLANAGIQVEGATRSTVINLFHLAPMTYESSGHQPPLVAWGHAVCNTKLGQRRCYSLAELQAEGHKVGILLGERVDTFGWISKSWEMIRSPRGAVWIRLCSDHDADGGADTVEEPSGAPASQILSNG